MVLLCPQPKPSMQMLAIALTVMVACTSDPGWLHMTRIKTSGACLAFTREACLCEHTRHRPSPPDPPRPMARPLDRECDTSPGSVLANRAAAEACRAPRVAAAASPRLAAPSRLAATLRLRVARLWRLTSSPTCLACPPRCEERRLRQAGPDQPGESAAKRPCCCQVSPAFHQ